ncbi:hypothetical protein C8R45DRAFT_549129 [Mycena sanguinolenta]|nr:hypothetical protein C8R45DRAFT_549129 [Mycena sanguinolenta]
MRRDSSWAVFVLSVVLRRRDTDLGRRNSAFPRLIALFFVSVTTEHTLHRVPTRPIFQSSNTSSPLLSIQLRLRCTTKPDFSLGAAASARVCGARIPVLTPTSRCQVVLVRLRLRRLPLARKSALVFLAVRFSRRRSSGWWRLGACRSMLDTSWSSDSRCG